MTREVKTFRMGAPSPDHNRLAWLGACVRATAKEHGISEDEAAKRYYPERYQVWKEKVEGKRLVPEW